MYGPACPTICSAALTRPSTASGVWTWTTVPRDTTATVSAAPASARKASAAHRPGTGRSPPPDWDQVPAEDRGRAVQQANSEDENEMVTVLDGDQRADLGEDWAVDVTELH